MRKSNGESSLVTTEEAKEITAEHRICRDASWALGRCLVHQEVTTLNKLLPVTVRLKMNSE